MSDDLASREHDSHRLPMSYRTLQGRLVLGMGAITFVVLAALAWASLEWVSRSLQEQTRARLVDAGSRSAALVDRLIEERARTTALLGVTPSVVDAAIAGAARAEQLGLVGRPIPELESRFGSTRTLDVDGRGRQYLRALMPTTGIAEAMVTDIHGFNAVITERTSDFVQSDERWWTEAMRTGAGPIEAAFDESADAVAISMSGTVRESGGKVVGVIKVVFGMAELDSALARAARSGGVDVDLIDASGKLLAGSSTAVRLEPFPNFAGRQVERDSTINYGMGDDAQRAAVAAVQSEGWRVVAHLPTRVADASFLAARDRILAAMGMLLILVLLSLFAVSNLIARRVSEPAAVLATVSERVAAGDLAVRITDTDGQDELGRLSRATDAMIGELRRLASAIRDAAKESAAMAAEITAGSEEMSAAASQMATTSNDLSQQSAEMAQTIQHAAGDASGLLAITTRLSDGAREGVARNTQLRALARENRERLDESARTLETLSSEAHTTTAAAESLAAASEEIRSFVTLVRKMARQSKLLALNAAMEAARAGERGSGFTVVASEIRKLARGAAEAADRTEHTVNEVLARVLESLESSRRTAQTVAAVEQSTRAAVQSFADVERAVLEAEVWTMGIERSASDAAALVQETTTRLDSLARGTESFAAAMQEVAASAEEQSASVEEIAAAASALAAASRELWALVATFRLDEQSATPRAHEGEATSRPLAAPAPLPA